jgi:lipoyl(octanoyl) transferase
MALEVDWLGGVPYRAALKLQEEALEARRAGGRDRLLLLEHPPVVTFGRSAREENLRVSRAELARRGMDCVEVARGGDVTYHAPGQLVGYLIVDLAAAGAPDVHEHLRSIEAALGEAILALGVSPETRAGKTGVFVADAGALRPRKIASIGVGVRGWVSWHGFALNVDLDLAGFDVIVPCGLHDVQMTSLAHELGPAAPADLAQLARQQVTQSFAARWS